LGQNFQLANYDSQMKQIMMRRLNMSLWQVSAK